ncbi:MAG TPA: hypothetical protein EYQ53_00755 [Candidatus Poseidoniales archaeon]|nr:hypothetical protein [Candidatus Poseidoniales archaeon]
MRSLRMLPSGLLVLLLCSATFAGCLGGDDDKKEDPFANSPITLLVYYDETSGTVTQNTRGDQVLSTVAAELSWDFSNTTSKDGEMSKFWITPGDGSEPVMADASSQTTITYGYETHGLFEVELGAEDSEGNMRNTTIAVRIEMIIHDEQSNTQNPGDVTIVMTPDNDGETPVHIRVNSTVLNPAAFIFGGGSTTVTWTLSNGTGETISEGEEELAEGEESTWTATYDNPELGDWTMAIDQSSNENLDITQDITITYYAGESAANPSPTA